MNTPLRPSPRPLLGVVFGCALILAGCASTPGGVNPVTGGAPAGDAADKAATTAQQAAVAEPDVAIETINVVGEGDKVLIETIGSVKYTIFRLSDPSRLIVDMPGVSLDNVSEPIAVDNDFITGIETVSYGGEENIGRITIGLKEGIDHEVKSGDGSILVSLVRDVFTADFSAEEELAAAAEGDVEESPLEAVAGGAGPTAEEQTPAASEPFPPVEKVERAISESLRPATILTSLSTENLGRSTVVRITADGAVGNYNAFDLEDPSRIVLDLWGVDNSIGRSRVQVDSEELAGVRIGRHPDKTRIVFDSDLPVPPAHSIEKSGDTIVVTFGESGEGAAAPAAPDAAVVVASIPAVAEAGPVAEIEPAAVEEEEETVFEGAVAEGAGQPAAEGETPGEQAAVDASGWDDPAAAEAAAMEAPPAIVAPEPLDAPEAFDAPEAAPAPPAPPARPETVASVDITGVDFTKHPDRATLTVSATAETGFTITEADEGKTLVIDIADAALPEGLQRTLDATRLATPVTTISSYQSAEVPRKNVRVLVRLAEAVSYDAVEHDGVLRLDFPLTAGEAAEVITDAAISAMAGPEAGGAEYTGARIDLDMTDANISDVLRLMAEVSNLNIIASDDVTGTVSLRLKGVPWDQAFDIILRAKGLDKVQDGNVVRVAPAEKVRQERESAIAAVRADEKLEELKLDFIPINYASAVDLVEHVTNVLTERGSVTSEARTNTLIVKDISKGIESARNLITKLDTVIPQVLIEARIIEATSSFARDLGVQWGLQFESKGNVQTNTFGSIEDQVFPGSETNAGNLAVPGTFPATTSSLENFAVNLPATGTAGTLGALGFIFGKLGNSPLLLDLRLSAGEQEGKLKTISRPKITTLDNKEAKIEQGESIPFETSSAAGTATTFIDANLSLTVTPHITPDGSVLMKIKASRNSIGTFRTASGEPSINKKEASTEVLVRDGETTVIGGIVVSDSNDTDKGIPFLKDIPLLGWVFKSKSKSDTQTELLIFLTPTIIRDQLAGAG